MHRQKLWFFFWITKILLLPVNVELVKIRTILELTGGNSWFKLPAKIRSMVRSSIFIIFLFFRDETQYFCVLTIATLEENCQICKSWGNVKLSFINIQWLPLEPQMLWYQLFWTCCCIRFIHSRDVNAIWNFQQVANYFRCVGSEQSKFMNEMVKNW